MHTKACRVLIAVFTCFVLAGCVTTSHTQITALERPEARQPRILLMPLDVELSELSAGGLAEPKADWTEAANKHMASALQAINTQRDLQLLTYDEEKLSAAKHDEIIQILKLHGIVGNSILLHQYLQPLALPTKAGKFDWSLGPAVRQLREETGADYALFFWVRDSYSSGGRVAVIMLAAVLGVGVQGGVQVGFASLVDLNTGNIVWFNRLARPTGDLRNEPAARETTLTLLSDLPK
jgi:hypothetical protein